MLNEILEIREKLETLILDFDKKVRNNFIVEAKYNVPLDEQITPVLVIEGQIKIHKQALKDLEDGKSLEEIQANVDVNRRKTLHEVYTHQSKLLAYKNIMGNLKKYNEADLLQLENLYKEAVLKHHPAITLIQDQEERNRFGLVRECYLQSDLESLIKALEQNKFGTYEDNNLSDEQALKESHIALDEFTREFERVSSFDENFKKLQIEVEDDMLLARNQAQLRQRLYQGKKEIVEVFERTAQTFNGAIDFSLAQVEQK